MTIQRPAIRKLLALAVALVALCSTASARAATTMTVTDCSSDAQLQADVAQANADNAGDTIAFACSGDIQLSSTISITASMTIDGTGQSVTLDGHDAVQDVAINTFSGPLVRLKSLTISNGMQGTSAYQQTFNGGQYTAGGVFAESGTLTITNCTFTGNSTSGPLAGFAEGGAVTDPAAVLNVTGSTFTGNEAAEGGAIWTNGDSTIDDSVIEGNTATAAEGDGGAIYYFGSSYATVSDTTIQDNTAASWGGGIFDLGSSMNVDSSTIADNEAQGAQGGGVYIDPLGYGAAITNSTIYGNNAAQGGGIYVDQFGFLALASTTVAGNGAANGGDGLAAVGPTTVTDSIIDNPGPNGNCYQTTGAIRDGGYNLDNGSTCGFTGTGSVQNTSAMLDPSGLQNNGGPTQTLALMAGSAAIDTIPQATCPATDQRGYPRPDIGENVCDMGAYESGSGLPVTLTVTPAGTGSGTVTSTPSGISCGSTCAATFPFGQQVTLAANPAPSSTFTGWSGGGCSGTGTCTVTMSANTSVTATFTTQTVSSADLSATLSGPASAKKLATFTETLTVTNHGPDAATPVVSGIVVPSGLTPVRWTAGGARLGGSVLWLSPALAAGASLTYQVTCAVSSTAPASETILGATYSPTIDPNPTNNVSEAKVHIGPPLATGKRAQRPANPDAATSRTMLNLLRNALSNDNRLRRQHATGRHRTPKRRSRAPRHRSTSR